MNKMPDKNYAIFEVAKLTLEPKDHLHFDSREEFDNFCNMLGKGGFVFKCQNMLYIILDNVFYTCEAENGK